MQPLEGQSRAVTPAQGRASCRALASKGHSPLCSAFSPDLRKFRTYKGGSVRDLLRAMRNKVRPLPHSLAAHRAGRPSPSPLSRRSITTTSCPPTCRRRWAPSLKASCSTSPPASRGSCCTRTAPCGSVPASGSSAPTTSRSRAARGGEGAPCRGSAAGGCGSSGCRAPGRWGASAHLPSLQLKQRLLGHCPFWGDFDRI